MITEDTARRTAADWAQRPDSPLDTFAEDGTITYAAVTEAEIELADYPVEYAADASRIELVGLVKFLTWATK